MKRRMPVLHDFSRWPVLPRPSFCLPRPATRCCRARGHRFRRVCRLLERRHGRRLRLCRPANEVAGIETTIALRARDGFPGFAKTDNLVTLGAPPYPVGPVVSRFHGVGSTALIADGHRHRLPPSTVCCSGSGKGMSNLMEQHLRHLVVAGLFRQILRDRDAAGSVIALAEPGCGSIKSE